MLKIWKLLLLAVLSATLIVASGCGKGNVVATVNGENITQQQMDEAVENMKQY